MDKSDQAGSKTTTVFAVVNEKYCGDGERELTVHKTSLFFPGDGYTAYDHETGELVFRVDTYERGPSLAHNIILMDPAGASILSVHRKWPSLHQRWEGFLGEKKEGQKPLFSVKRSSIFRPDRSTGDVETYDADGSREQPIEESYAQRSCCRFLMSCDGCPDQSAVYVETHDADGSREYRIVGSFAQRSCRFLKSCDGGGEFGDSEEEEVVLAEIKRKVDASCSHVVLGKDVLSLCLRPRFDAAFAMGLLLVLDQISSDDGNMTRDNRATAVAPSDEDDHQNNENRE